MIEGRGYDDAGAVRFNAFGIVSFDPATRAYTLHSHAQGHVGDFAFVADRRRLPLGDPARPRRRCATSRRCSDGELHEVGDRIVDGREPVRVFEMRLKRIGDTDWPAAGAVAPNSAAHEKGAPMRRPFSCFASARGLLSAALGALVSSSILRVAAPAGASPEPRTLATRPEPVPPEFPGARASARARSSRRGAAAAGSVRTTRVPRPSVLSTATSPPCSSAMRLTIARPRPRPPSAVAGATVGRLW